MSWQLSAALPPTVALRRWLLLFDTNLHGVSLQTFFQKCNNHRPALLVIKDESNTCFGGYNPEGFREGHHYYGNGKALAGSAFPPLQGKLSYSPTVLAMKSRHKESCMYLVGPERTNFLYIRTLKGSFSVEGKPPRSREIVCYQRFICVRHRC
eukprot:Gregarina_sp_Poly_1__4875@NODE_2594_length_1938_cov_121_157670_g967_i1_p3_GENE_NODE_2594_length_1938_cov_121_157670_g967_i1NODE_2594_length_1938_cov_121_157670_g967_i1_p3_ORF_typecomplete_len153_score6_41TLD/PF07534_16/1_7e15_NODE_2594_length_1938_cov_121_157670_g967_i137495